MLFCDMLQEVKKKNSKYANKISENEFDELMHSD